MELEISTIMMILFILLLILSIWKIYVFLPNKELEDDDTTEASQDELMHLLLSIVSKGDGQISEKELFQNIKNDTTFDKKHFWRFNQNRLNQLLNHYYLENEGVTNIQEIYENIKH